MTTPFNGAYFYPQHRVSITDNLRSGNAASSAGQLLGVPLQNFVREVLGALNVQATNTTGVMSVNVALAAQPIAGATTVPANTAPTGGTLVAGVATFDFPRNMLYASANAGDTTQTILAQGFDYYGAPMSELITLNGQTSVVGKKAFASVASFTVSAATAGNISVGAGGAFGLSYKIAQGGFNKGLLNFNTADAGTVIGPDQTNPATTATGDVRGTYTPAGTVNGTNIYYVQYFALNGPNNSDGYGQAQV